jgi:hypothetical protein
MRRMLLGLALALASIAANAGGQPPLPVSVTTIPENLDQRRPIDVQVVGTAVMDFAQVRANLANTPFDATKGDQMGRGWIESSYKTFTGPMTVRMVVFLPASYTSPPSTDPSGFPCQGSFFLSQDDGNSWNRIADTMWAAPNFSPSHILLPMPIFVAPGVTITTKVRLWMADGSDTAGCRVRAMLWGHQP